MVLLQLTAVLAASLGSEIAMPVLRHLVLNAVLPRHPHDCRLPFVPHPLVHDPPRPASPRPPRLLSLFQRMLVVARSMEERHVWEVSGEIVARRIRTVEARVITVPQLNVKPDMDCATRLRPR